MSFRRHISLPLSLSFFLSFILSFFPAAACLPVFFVKNYNNYPPLERRERQPPTPALFLLFFCFFFCFRGEVVVVWLIFHLILAALIVFGYHDELETVPGVVVAAAFDVVHTSPGEYVSCLGSGLGSLPPRALNSI